MNEQSKPNKFRDLNPDDVRRIKIEAYKDVLKDLRWQRNNLSNFENQAKTVEMSINRLINRISWASKESGGGAHGGEHVSEQEFRKVRNFHAPRTLGYSDESYEVTERQL